MAEEVIIYDENENKIKKINKEYVKKFIENLKKLDDEEVKEYLKITQLAFLNNENK